MSSQEDYLDSLLKGIVEDEDSENDNDFNDFDLSDVDELLRSVSEQFFAGEDILESSEDDEMGGMVDVDFSDEMNAAFSSDSDNDSINEMDNIDEINNDAGVGEIDLAELFASSSADEEALEDDFDSQDIQDLFEQADDAQAGMGEEDLSALFDATVMPEDGVAEDDEEDDGYESNSDDADDLIALLQGADDGEMDIPSLSDITDVELPDHSEEDATMDDTSLEELLNDMNSLDGGGDELEESLTTDGANDNSDIESLMGAVGIGDLFGATSEGEFASADDLDGAIVDLMDLDLGQDEGKTVEKKGGFFSRIWNFLTEEDEEEEEVVKGTEDVPLSDENKTVIEEVEKEKKKKKDKKKKKNKKGQQEEGELPEGEEETEADDKKKKKKKKEKKKKDEPAEGLEPQIPEKKLSTKRVAIIGAICLTIGLVILICSNIVSDFMIKNVAREAYYEEDYFTCYQNLYGKELNESEEVMLHKSECVLRIRLWVEKYDAFQASGATVEALDSLIQSVSDYDKLYEYAKEWAVEDAVANEYASVLAILSDKYQLTDEQAREIAAIKDDVQYTKVVTAIANGESYGEAPEREERLEDLKDVLPEEKELLEKIFGK